MIPVAPLAVGAWGGGLCLTEGCRAREGGGHAHGAEGTVLGWRPGERSQAAAGPRKAPPAGASPRVKLVHWTRIEDQCAGPAAPRRPLSGPWEAGAEAFLLFLLDPAPCKDQLSLKEKSGFPASPQPLSQAGPRDTPGSAPAPLVPSSPPVTALPQDAAAPAASPKPEPVMGPAVQAGGPRDLSGDGQ